MDLSVVIPAHNEADSLVPLVGEIRAALDGAADYEIVLVDDGSGDGTAERAAALARAFPRLRLARHASSRGQSFAIVTGVRAASAPWIATLDGDGQNDPADIPRLLAARDAALGARSSGWGAARSEWSAGGAGSGGAGAAAGGPLLVAGYRKLRHDTWLKRLSSRVANGVRGRLLGDATPDTGCGLKLFEREAFLGLPHFDHMHRFLPALFVRAGGRVVSVEVGHRPRARGRSHYGVWNRLWVGIVDLFGVWWLMRRKERR
jgi:dolichol-phosphate mannosyltransferase